MGIEEERLNFTAENAEVAENNETMKQWSNKIIVSLFHCFIVIFFPCVLSVLCGKFYKFLMYLKKRIFQIKPFRETVKYFSLKNRLKRPLKVTIEITNACNSDCIMCPRQSMTRPVRNMDFELYKKIVSDCGRIGVKIIQPFNFGEPLLNKRLGDFIRYAKENTESRVQISTNGSMLDDERAREILDSGLDRINIDIDGFSKDTYKKVRRNLDFDRVVENAERFIEMKKRLNKKIFITVSIINMDETMGEIERFKRYWRYKADRVLDVKYNTWIGSVEDRNISAPNPDPLPSGERQGSHCCEALQWEAVREKFNCPCKMLWDQMVILQDGRVALYCLDYDGKVIVGDMKKDTISDVWNGKPLDSLRQKQIELRFDEIPACSDCNQYVYMEGTQWQYMWGGY